MTKLMAWKIKRKKIIRLLTKFLPIFEVIPVELLNYQEKQEVRCKLQTISASKQKHQQIKHPDKLSFLQMQSRHLLCNSKNFNTPTDKNLGTVTIECKSYMKAAIQEYLRKNKIYKKNCQGDICYIDNACF